MNGMEDFGLRFTQAVVHFLWVGALVAVMLHVVDRLMIRSSAARHGWYLLGMLLMVVLFPLCMLVVGDGSRSVTLSSVAEVGSREATAERADLVANNEGVKVPGGADQGIRSELDGVAEESEYTIFVVESGGQWQRLAPWAMGFYLTGISIMLMRLFFGLWGSSRLREQSRPVYSGLWPSAVKRMGEAVGVKVQPLLKWSSEVASPVVIGLAKPVILLPMSLATRLSSSQVEAVLAHELAHLRRRDTWAVVAQRLIETVLFFHPLVWWMSRQLEKSREEACDDLVVAAGCDPADYAEALVICSEIRLEETGLAEEVAMRLAATGKGKEPLRLRVLRLLGQGQEEPVRLGRAGWIAGLLVVSGVALVAAAGSGGRNDLTDFDFDHPPGGYEKGIKAADRNHRIEVDGIPFQFTDLKWNKDGYLQSNLGVSGPFEIVEFRLFDHATRELFHDSRWQHGGDPPEFFIERWGATNLVRMKKAGGTFPEKVDVWMRVAIHRPGKTLVLAANDGASEKAGASEVVVTSILEGTMNGKGSGPGGRMIWDKSTAHGQDRSMIVNLENRGDPLKGRYHLVAVKKDGSRHPMDHTHYTDFEKMGRHVYVDLDVAVKDLGHLELIPFKDRAKFFFNGVSIPAIARPAHSSLQGDRGGHSEKGAKGQPVEDLDAGFHDETPGFLEGIPEFRNFSLKMSEDEFKDSLDERVLYSTVEDDDDGGREYWVLSSKGENLIVGFADSEGCTGIQRMQPMRPSDIEGQIGEMAFRKWQEKLVRAHTEDFDARTRTAMVTGPDGDGLDGVEVKAFVFGSEEPVMRTTTDGGGHFMLPESDPGVAPFRGAKPGYTLEFSKVGYRQWMNRVFLKRDKEGRYDRHDFLMRKATSLSGKLLGVDGKPLRDAQIRLITMVSGPDQFQDTSRPFAMTGENGGFRFDKVLPGQHLLNFQGVVGKEALNSSHTAVAMVETSDAKDEVLSVEGIMLDLSQSTASLEASLLDQDGQPLRNAELSLQWKEHEGVGIHHDQFPVAKANAEGEINLSGIPPGEWSLRIEWDQEKGRRAEIRHRQRFDAGAKVVRELKVPAIEVTHAPVFPTQRKKDLRLTLLGVFPTEAKETLEGVEGISSGLLVRYLAEHFSDGMPSMGDVELFAGGDRLEPGKGVVGGGFGTIWNYQSVSDAGIKLPAVAEIKSTRVREDFLRGVSPPKGELTLTVRYGLGELTEWTFEAVTPGESSRPWRERMAEAR